MKKDYQMTTVYKYIEMLDNELSPEEKKVRKSAEKYLLQNRKNNVNAIILEQMLC